jgi:hypothetical protein
MILFSCTGQQLTLRVFTFASQGLPAEVRERYSNLADI